MLGSAAARRGADPGRPERADRPLVTTDHVVRGKERALWAARGARAADMESAVVAARAGGLPVAAVRVVVDGPGHPLWHPGMIGRGLAGRRVLARIGPALERWSVLLVRGEEDSGDRPAAPRMP